MYQYRARHRENINTQQQPIEKFSAPKTSSLIAAIHAISNMKSNGVIIYH